MNLSITDPATSYSIMASLFLGDVQQEKENYFRELEFRLKDLGPEHVDVAGSYYGLGTVCHVLGELQQAKDYHGRALDIRLKNLGPEHVDVADCYCGLGNVCVALGELQQAKYNYGRALNILLKNLGPEHVDVADCYRGLGNVCVALGELQQAKYNHGRVLNILLKNLGPENVCVAGSYNALGTIFHACGEFQEAQNYHGRALNILLKNFGPAHDLVAHFGSVYCYLGNEVRANDYIFERNIRANLSELENIIAAECYRNKANICDVIGIPKQAKDWNERVQTILRKNNRTERADVPSLSKFQAVHSVPPYILARGSIAKAAYQRALETGKTFDKRAKILLIGQDRVGKTSVLRSLKGELFRQDESSTLGVQIGMPLKHVGEKPWKNSKEEQEKSTFHYKCALNISNQLLTEPPNEIYVDSEVTKQTETDETQRTEGRIGEIGSNVGM